MKLLLTGYRATGKTSVGSALARRLGVKFVDSDHLIQEETGKSVAEIVAESGWPGFRAMEKAVLREIIHKEGDAVVSCGGGAVLHGDIFENLPEGVLVVWLKAAVDSIVSRIEADSQSASLRPSLSTASTLRDEVSQVLSEREPLYGKFSDYALDTDRMNISDIVSELEKIWKEGSK